MKARWVTGLKLVILICSTLVTIVLSNDANSKEDKMTEEYSEMLKQYHDWTRRLRGSKTCAKDGCKESGKPNNRRRKMCYCDQDCEKFGDCCLDYWKSCNSTFPGVGKQYIKYKCMATKRLMPNATKKGENPSINGYEVVTKCPLGYSNLEIKESCEDLAEESFFVDGEDGVTYRNHHCASCNNVTRWKYWESELTCPVELASLINKSLSTDNLTLSDQKRKEIRETCSLSMVPMNWSTVITCTILPVCTDTASPDYNKCLLYTARVYLPRPKTPPIRNPHCLRCSGSRVRRLRLRPFGRRPNGGGRNSLAVLFDFSKADAIYGLELPKKKIVVKKCGPNQVYDFTLKRCRAQRVTTAVESTRNWTCLLQNETFPNTTEYVTMLGNRTVLVLSHNRTYPPEMYHLHDGNITVCGNFTAHFLETQCQNGSGLPTLYTDVEYYITLIGFTLSILALLIVLVTYAMFSELRTLPGKIVMNLAVALVLSQVVLLFDIVEDVSGDTCRAIAVVLHYLYIAAFCWMNAMAYDVARTFAGKSHRSPSGSRNKVFLFCILYAWGVPLVIVGIALAVNHTGTLDVGYGNDYYCWLTNPIALAVCFAAPVALMLLFNIVALIRVLVAVRRVRKVTKKVRDGSSAGQDLGMCWKLTSVFGVTWILGLGAGYHIVLRIIYIVFNSLQGVFIMMGFVMTKRVLNLCLTRSGKRPLTTGTSSKSRTTSTTVVNRIKTNSTTSQIERKPLAPKKQPEAPEEEDRAAIDIDSAEAQLIAKMEGPETRL